jgi:hypothetical protein
VCPIVNGYYQSPAVRFDIQPLPLHRSQQQKPFSAQRSPHSTVKAGSTSAGLDETPIFNLVTGELYPQRDHSKTELQQKAQTCLQN